MLLFFNIGLALTVAVVTENGCQTRLKQYEIKSSNKTIQRKCCKGTFNFLLPSGQKNLLNARPSFHSYVIHTSLLNPTNKESSEIIIESRHEKT